MREGEVDPLFGQRSAFPVSSDPELIQVNAYFDNVRREAQELVANAAQRNARAQSQNSCALDWGSPVSGQEKLEEVTEPKLDYQPIAKLTVQLCNQELAHDLDPVALFRLAHAKYSQLPPVHPAECTSLATWKSYTSENDPVPLDHTNTFRVLKYLTRWNYSSERHFCWSWALLLRTPTVLTGDEISLLRAVCKQLKTFSNVWYHAFAMILSEIHGQHDMVWKTE